MSTQTAPHTQTSHVSFISTFHFTLWQLLGVLSRIIITHLKCAHCTSPVHAVLARRDDGRKKSTYYLKPCNKMLFQIVINFTFLLLGIRCECCVCWFYWSKWDALSSLTCKRKTREKEKQFKYLAICCTFPYHVILKLSGTKMECTVRIGTNKHTTDVKPPKKRRSCKFL